MNQNETLEAFRARFDGGAIATYVLVMLAVPAKLWCKTKVGGRHNLGLDDALAVVTLVWANVFFWINMAGLRQHLGQHFPGEVTADELGTFLKFLFAASLTYVCTIAFIKFTILALYWRLFSVYARISIGVTAFTVFGWLIAFICLGIFACDPVRAQWDITVENPKCLEQRAIYLGGSLPNVIVDFILVGLPMPRVWKLNAPLGQRLILAGMFALGLFISIVSIIRLTIVLSVPVGSFDYPFNLKDFMLWSTVEINIGLVCACLPSMRPLLKTIGLSRLFPSSDKRSNATPGPSGLNNTDDPSRRDLSKSRKKGSARDVFSSITGLTKLGSEEEVYKMIDQQPYGKSKAEIEVGRASSDADSESRNHHHHVPQARGDGIVVQRDWSVLVGEGERSRH